MKQTAYIETRQGAGGDEAKIWASDLLRMYLRYCIKKGWSTSQLDESTLMVKGEDVFDLLKNESGVHRVQRVPQTEKRGRTHTSTATIAVLPEITPSEVSINPQDLEWQFFRASSQGGQNVQKVSSAVRLIHKPSGVVVTSQQERYQEQNRKIALELLRAKLWEKEKEKSADEAAGYRSAIGTADRSEKIRTYNFPQNRVTDHRIKKSWGNLDKVIDGDLEKILSFTNKA